MLVFPLRHDIQRFLLNHRVLLRQRLPVLPEVFQFSLNYLIGSGYINLDTPVIEPADLFFRKSLGSTSGNTYTFTDSQNQQVSLRPDFTASIMRYAFSNSKKIEKVKKICKKFNPVILDKTNKSVVIQVTALRAEIDKLALDLKSLGLISTSRTGAVAMTKGSRIFN